MIVQGNAVMRFMYASGSRPLDGYTIKRGIGVGGFGEVYFAISDAGKEVAIKRIQRNLDIELRGVRQCLNMKHVNLIALWDIRSSDMGETWVVMEYVPGYSLRDVLARYPQGMPDDQVRTWITSIAAGVNYLHGRGIVHRDLKPGNVFFDSDSEVVKIGDYGLSKFISGSRRSGHTESVGTFHYMAPEIGRGSYGKEIDIYAIGVMLYEMLCGQPPFDGETTHEIIMKHMTAEPDLSRIPAVYQRVVERCLRKDPSERFSSVVEMIADTPWRQLTGDTGQGGQAGASVDVLADRAAADQPTRLQMDWASRQADHSPQPVMIDEQSAAEAEKLVERIRHRLDDGWRAADLTGAADGSGTQPFILADQRAAKAPREPIARFLYDSAHQMSDWWQRLDWTTPWKVFLLIAVAIVLVGHATWLLPTAAALGILYAIYFGIRAIFFKDKPVLPSTVYRPRATTDDIRMIVARRLAERDWTEQSAEVVGALFKAAIASSVFSGLFFAIRGFEFNPESVAIAVWAAISSTLVAWTVLLTTRVWPWQPNDRLFRMLVLASLGAGLGLTAYFIIAQLTPEPRGFAMDRWSHGSLAGMHSAQLATRFMFAMAILVGVIRWWKLTDPWRRNRIVFWRVAFGIGLAIGAGYALGFESWLPWVISVAIISTQLAAPWYHPEVRQLHDRQRLAMKGYNR
ncbi:MAG TPA: serine/threonine-protein kinase [Pirellulaceae bacterium]|nr:serine/threonine-protein kinase [Pirellulaceae bacterium]